MVKAKEEERKRVEDAREEQRKREEEERWQTEKARAFQLFSEGKKAFSSVKSKTR